jgi:hypothetical protein
MTSPSFSPGGCVVVMGIKERRFDPLPHEISLEDLVPKDDFYRRLEAALDLSFVRNLVRPLYARGGRPSVDPVVFFKLQLVMFFEGLRSEWELMRVAADRLSVRWYLGYDLHEPEASFPAANDAALKEHNAFKSDWISRDGRQRRGVKGVW